MSEVLQVELTNVMKNRIRISRVFVLSGVLVGATAGFVASKFCERVVMNTVRSINSDLAKEVV